jgi:hypothetical protein
MSGLFRPRLYGIKSEKALFKYFEKHAGSDGNGVYHCAGIIAHGTDVLFQLLKEEWKKDVATHKLEVKRATIHEAKSLLGK